MIRMKIYSTEIPSPLGMLTLASDGISLIGLWFEGQKHFGGAFVQPFTERHDLPVFRSAELWLNEYFAGKRPSPSLLPLALYGTEFQKKVWTLLGEIPYGKTVSYGWLAEKVSKLSGTASCARAVGGAVGRNPISIILPCHRVVGMNGAMTGFAAGLERKRFLLSLELSLTNH